MSRIVSEIFLEGSSLCFAVHGAVHRVQVSSILICYGLRGVESGVQRSEGMRRQCKVIESCLIVNALMMNVNAIKWVRMNAGGL